MHHALSPMRRIAAVAVIVAGASTAGCEQRTTTTLTPSGSTTVTTVAPTAGAASVADRVMDAVSDAALTAKVKAVLLADDSVKGLRIDVDTHAGAVTLNGSADSQANVARAERLAASVDGVRSVTNRLSVAATDGAAAASAGAALSSSVSATVDRATDAAGRATAKVGDVLEDAAITAKVKTAFLADEAVKGLQIDVDTKGGVVTLTGSLEQRADIERAGSIAQRIGGVKSVENRLTVKKPG